MIVPPFDRESLVTTYALYRLERGGIPVWREISNTNRDFQAVLRQKQPDANLAMIKWLNREQKANIKPTWKNLFLVLRLINLDGFTEKIETFMSGTTVSEESTVSKEGELDSVFTMASLTQLETDAGIPVLSELEAKNYEFQAIIRVKQHNVSGAINKWLASPVLSRIVPTWKNFLSILCLIRLDDVAQKVKTYLSNHPLSSLGSEGDKGEEIAALRKEIVALRQQLSDRDETISEQKQQIEASEATIKVLKEKNYGKLSTAAGVIKEFITKPEHPLTQPSDPVPSPMPARSKPHPVPEQSEEAMWMRPLEEPTVVGHPSYTLEQKTTHIKTEHYTTVTADVESQGIKSPEALVQKAELSPPPPPEMGELKSTPTAAGFRGVEVCAETTVEVTNSPRPFVWQGYGLKLNIPKGSLPAGTTIYIQASLSGQYEFPENSHLVSAVFWLRCKPRCTFSSSISLEINHCAKSANTSKLSIVRAVCSQKNLPYKFERLGGNFNQHSSFGEIELNSFSGVTVTQDGSEEREYCAMLYYLRIDYELSISFVVTWNTKTHLTEVKENYKQEGALLGHTQPIEFKPDSDSITLDIPMEGVVCTGWKILPLFTPVVFKKKVDSFEPGKMIPSCQLCAKFSGKKITSFDHHVCLLGAKKPYDSFLMTPPASIFAGATKGVAVKIERPSDEIIGEGPSPKKIRVESQFHSGVKVEESQLNIPLSVQSQGTREETPSSGAWSREPNIHQGREQPSQTSYDYGYQDLQGSELRLATITSQAHKYAPLL